jgi:hypothetical protein
VKAITELSLVDQIHERHRCMLATCRQVEKEMAMSDQKDVADGTHEGRPALVLPNAWRERRVALLEFVFGCPVAPFVDVRFPFFAADDGFLGSPSMLGDLWSIKKLARVRRARAVKLYL